LEASKRADRVKNKRAHLVLLAAPAQAVLAGWTKRYGDFVFAHGGFRSWSYGK
jgi:hypothetical protein